MAPTTNSMTNSMTNYVPTQEQLAVIQQLHNDRDVERQIIQISKITDYTGLELIAQISYHTHTGIDEYQLYFGRGFAFLDDFHRSWRFPIMTVRRLLHLHFDDDMPAIIDELPTLDNLVSHSPLIDVHVHPQFYPDYDY